MPDIRVTYEHAGDVWWVTKDSRRMDHYDTKSKAESRARSVAKKAKRSNGYATLQIEGTGGQVTDYHEYGDQTTTSLF